MRIFVLLLLVVPIQAGLLDSVSSLVYNWNDNNVGLCDNEDISQHGYKNELYCTRYMVDYRWTNIEVFSFDPVLIVFRDLLDQHVVQQLIHKARNFTMSQQKLMGDKVINTTRNANGTWLDTNDDFVKKTRKFMQARIPNVNLNIAEQFSVLSYLKGGHYVPHHDASRRAYYGQEEWWTHNYGMRYATLILVLKTAERGGGTVFPEIRTTIRPTSGDALFWINIKANENLLFKSLHGGCPVYEGEKIITTLWIHASRQPILVKSTIDGRIDIEALVAPFKYRHGLAHPWQYKTEFTNVTLEWDYPDVEFSIYNVLKVIDEDLYIWLVFGTVVVAAVVFPMYLLVICIRKICCC